MFRRTLTHATLRQGARELAARDCDLACAIDRLGYPPIWGRRPGFASLVRIILEQQVSLRSAAAMYRRLDTHLDGVSPDTFARAGIKGLRRLGVTRQKAAYCYGLARRVVDGTLDLRAVARAADEDGRRTLLDIPGLGPWSVDIYYLMALRRPDVWPRGDLALAAALREVKRLPMVPSHERQLELSSVWTPWRSVAARILWAHYLARRRSPPRLDPVAPPARW